MIKSINRASRDGGRAFLEVTGRRAERRFIGSEVGGGGRCAGSLTQPAETAMARASTVLENFTPDSRGPTEVRGDGGSIIGVAELAGFPRRSTKIQERRARVSGLFACSM